MTPPPATFTRLTPAASFTGGAVSLIQIEAPADMTDAEASAAIDHVLACVGIGPQSLPIGAVRLHRFADVDDALLARVSARTLHVSTHAGRAVEDAVTSALCGKGLRERVADELHPLALYPEARSLAEACALEALSRAHSPDAVAPVLRQIGLWNHAEASRGMPAIRGATPEEARALDRLIIPPTVAVIGPANVGKSTLLNAMARAEVALALDQPGTTLDHVGVTLTLRGVTLHWLDTPGWQPGPLPPAHAEALALARAAVANADLVLSAGDAQSGFIDAALMGAGPRQRVMRIGTRSDGGRASGADMHTSAVRDEGLDELASAVSEALVPAALRADTPRWVFHPLLNPDPRGAPDA